MLVSVCSGRAWERENERAIEGKGEEQRKEWDTLEQHEIHWWLRLYQILWFIVHVPIFTTSKYSVASSCSYAETLGLNVTECCFI